MDNQAHIENVVNITESAVLTSSQTTIIDSHLANASSDFYLYVIAIIMGLLIIYLIFKNKSSKQAKKEIALVGERGSGKTQLFIGLCGGKAF